MDKNKQPILLEYPVLVAFRLGKKWIKPDKNKTIRLQPRQAQFLVLDGKLGAGKPVELTQQMTKPQVKEVVKS
ncbi:hypothetical protein [Vibrio splendidus]|uniref:hypothetical protein n=1 Tax=Vibrio splendidus TaxID=29497 RepID=UPI000C822355|nr:hypothetical protein [Vibrio splendidus]PMI49574.1 hypothetical protein BCU42_14365 [Vibrio splendidus]